MIYNDVFLSSSATHVYYVYSNMDEYVIYFTNDLICFLCLLFWPHPLQPNVVFISIIKNNLCAGLSTQFAIQINSKMFTKFVFNSSPS